MKTLVEIAMKTTMRRTTTTEQASNHELMGDCDSMRLLLILIETGNQNKH